MYARIGSSAVMLAFVVGCAGSKAATPRDMAVSPASASLTIAATEGKYTLATVDGYALPHAPRAAGTSARQVMSGSFLLNANGTFRLETIYGADAATTAAATGSCYIEGNEVKMVWDGGGLTNMTTRGDTLLLKREGALFGYIRAR
jgi:hypothetical protein